VRDRISQQAGRCCLNVQNAFLTFKIQSIAITIGYFTELRGSLTVFICKEILLIKYFKNSYFTDKFCCIS
jgi:hypothetical protein